MKNLTFKFYSANVSVNYVSVAVYQNKAGNYVLQVEKHGKKVRGTSVVEMTVDEYENLQHDPYNSMVRFQAALSACGYSLN